MSDHSSLRSHWQMDIYTLGQASRKNNPKELQQSKESTHKQRELRDYYDRHNNGATTRIYQQVPRIRKETREKIFTDNHTEPESKIPLRG